MQSKWFTRAICLVLSLSFAFCSVFTSNNMFVAEAKYTQAEANAKKDKIQKRIDETQGKLDNLKAEERNTEKHLKLLDTQIAQKQDKIDSIQDKIDALDSEISDVEANIKKINDEIAAIDKEIETKEAAFEQTFDTYSNRLRAMYISGHVSNLEVLLSSSDMSSILVRSQMINSVSKQDSALLDSLIKQMEDIEKDKASRLEKYNKLTEDQAKLEADKEARSKEKASAVAEKAALDKDVAEANKIMRNLASKETEYMESIENDTAEQARIQREVEEVYHNNENASTGGGYLPGGGSLAYPTSYRRISAGYPNYSSGRYHGGVDFPCPTGTPVHASADGTVIMVKRLNYSYGHHFIIDHGNGLSTLCAHNSNVIVSVGQKVKKGEVVAYSGTTGNSTGPHVHFEVRVNGKRVNPNNYLG